MRGRITSVLSWVSILVISCIVSFLLYFPGLHGPFMLDDPRTLKPLADLPLSLDSLITAYHLTDSGVHSITRVLPTWSFIFTFNTLGDQAYGFKLTNTLIHSLIGSILFVFIVKLLKFIQPQLYGSKARFIAISATMMWLVHPLFVSTVLYSAQRIAQLSTLFVLVTLTLYCTARQSNSLSVKKWIYLVFLPLSAVAGLMSKENAVLIAPLILLIELASKSHQPGSIINIERRAIFMFTLLPILVGFILVILMSDRLFDYSSRSFDLSERLLSQIYFIAFYLKQILLPRLSDMTLFFDGFDYPRSLNFQLISLLFIHFGLLSAAAYYVTRGSIISFGILFFYVAHALESTVLPLELAFEHRNYLPAVGIFISISAICSKILNFRQSMFVSLLAIVLLAVLCSLRVGFWSSEKEWIQTQIAFQPKSIRARVSYLDYLKYNKQMDEYGKVVDQAIDDFQFDAGLRVSRIMANCNESATQTVIDNDFYSIRRINQKHEVSVSVVSNLNVLAWHSVLNKCKNYTTERVEQLILEAIEALDSQGTEWLKAYLFDTLGFIKSSNRQFDFAWSMYERSYSISNRFDYFLNTVSFFAKQTETHDIAIELLNRFEKSMASSNIAYTNKVRSIKSMLSDKL